MTKRSKSNKSQPLKNIISGLTAPLARVEPPTTKKRRKRVDTQEREARTEHARETKRAREALRKRGIPPTTAQAEAFIRRSIASQRAAAAMSAQERSERSRKGWATSNQRGTRHARSRKDRETADLGRQKRSLQEHPHDKPGIRHPGNWHGGPIPF